MSVVAIAAVLLLGGCVVGLLSLVAVPIVLALFLVGLVLRLVFFVLFLPFRLAGAALGLGLAGIGGVLLGAVLLLAALPILPLALVAAGIYLVVKGMRSAPVTPSPSRQS